MRLGIVGLGLIGGSLALALRRALPRLEIVGVDLHPPTRAAALPAGAVDSCHGLPDAPLHGCDAVVLAVPAHALVEMVVPVAHRLREGAVLTDVCGAKEQVCARGAAQDQAIFVGGHPMAGTEFSGFLAASAGLFSGATVALCPPAGGPPGADRAAATALVEDLWRSAGAARMITMAPDAHDRAVTYASHLPYLAAAAVVDALACAGDDAALARDLAAGGFRDTTRVAGDSTVSGAASLNRFLPDAAEALARELRALADGLARDPIGVTQRLRALADVRRAMPLPGTPRR